MNALLLLLLFQVWSLHRSTILQIIKQLSCKLLEGIYSMYVLAEGRCNMRAETVGRISLEINFRLSSFPSAESGKSGDKRIIFLPLGPFGVVFIAVCTCSSTKHRQYDEFGSKLAHKLHLFPRLFVEREKDGPKLHLEKSVERKGPLVLVRNDFEK